MHSDLLDILRVFSHYKVEYLIVGGYAVAFHAEPRLTKDLDILVRASGENAWARRVESTIGDVAAFFISKEDLIATKTAAGRPQDLVDVQTLTAYQYEKKSKE